jgi:hypothetical protein
MHSKNLFQSVRNIEIHPRVTLENGVTVWRIYVEEGTKCRYFEPFTEANCSRLVLNLDRKKSDSRPFLRWFAALLDHEHLSRVMFRLAQLWYFSVPTDVVSFWQNLKSVFKWMSSRILSRCWTLLHIYKIRPWWWITWWLTYQQHFPALPLRNRKMQICRSSWNTHE